MQDDALLFSISQIISKFALVSLVIVVVSISGYSGFLTLLFITFSSIFFTFIFLLFTLASTLKKLNSSIICFENISKSFIFGVPLVFSGLLFSALTSFDRVFLKEYSSLTELGLYSVSISFAAVATIFQSVFSVIWAPTVYKWKAQGVGLDMVPSISSTITFLVSLIFCLAGIFSWLVDYLIPSEYGDVKYILVSCLVYPLLYTLSEVTGIGIGITKKTYWTVLIGLVCLFVNVVLNFVLIPTYGAKGAAITTAITFFVFFILRTEISSLIWFSIPRVTIYTFISLHVALSCCVTFFGAVYNDTFILVYLILLIFTLFIYRKFLFLVVNRCCPHARWD
ncbi:lipopolysaccharide biosynthesis protein [Shewanella baltica]|uniref:lipopolysaccharide biosynthesis protein n=1 Tax=Shewanella baltica TaxID=62322 RepID=UPI001559F56D|nr:polysaccharide biosynthesis C-terminal domain-containing protein [Shewanella baltica]